MVSIDHKSFHNSENINLETLEQRKYDYLNSIYSIPNPTEAYLGSIESIYRTVKDQGVFKITMNEIKHYLSTRDAYTQNRFYKRPRKLRKLIVGSPFNLIESDLLYFRNGAANDNYFWFCLCVDHFTKKIWVKNIKSKAADNIVACLNEFFRPNNSECLISNLLTDFGKEYRNSKVKLWCLENNVRLLFSYSEHKASEAERYNLVLRNHVAKFCAMNSTDRFIDNLQDIVQAINETRSRITHYRPNDITFENAKQVFFNTYGSNIQKIIHDNSRSKSFDNDFVKVNAFCRVAKPLFDFQKRSENTYTEEIYIISKIFDSNPPMVELKDFNFSKVLGKFYLSQIQIVALPHNYLMPAEILSKKNQNVLVHWFGFPHSTDRWISSELILPQI